MNSRAQLMGLASLTLSTRSRSNLCDLRSAVCVNDKYPGAGNFFRATSKSAAQRPSGHRHFSAVDRCKTCPSTLFFGDSQKIYESFKFVTFFRVATRSLGISTFTPANKAKSLPPSPSPGFFFFFFALFQFRLG